MKIQGNTMIKKQLAAFIFILSWAAIAHASDWPIYKGNMYFTGNNDEITVKNNNLKWLRQFDNQVYNPIISDGRVYILDIKKNIFCLDEETGSLIWKADVNAISRQFSAHSKAMGKVKYPLIKGNRLFLTDNIAIYCLNKITGEVLWARTGFREEQVTDSTIGGRNRERGKADAGEKGRFDKTKSSRGTVDGIYSDPMIHEDSLYYGTRNIFISRDISNGRMNWNNSEIKTYSGFPSFYDNLVFTQSMDYTANVFTLMCMDAISGKISWSRRIANPMKIFSPVIYAGKVFLASNKTLYSIGLRDGALLWEKEYPDFITSNPSFTERDIIFSIGNRDVAVVNPENGEIKSRINPGKGLSPYFVIVSNQIYISATFEKEVGNRMLPYASLRSMNLNSSAVQWEFIPPFPGGANQPAASKGIMFLPSGNYLYAVGTDYYPSIVNGGSSRYDPYNTLEKNDKPGMDKKGDKDPDTKTGGSAKKDESKEMKTRKMNIGVKGDDGAGLSGHADIRKWDKGKIIWSGKVPLAKNGGEIDVPDADDVEITVHSDGYIPKKVIISRQDNSRDVVLDKIEKGKSFVVENIYFETDEAHLKKESLNILDSIITVMKKERGIKLEVKGHTDNEGTREYNRKLSERRADAVVEYMVKNGISPERLKSSGLGLDKPIADNSTPQGRKKNRRTEFFILER